MLKIVPNYKEIADIAINILAITGVMFIAGYIISCSDDTFIAGYNKDMEEIHQSIFEIDSVMRTINLQLDSSIVDWDAFYLNAKRINSGHE